MGNGGIVPSNLKTRRSETMTTLITTSLKRKIALALGAIVVSTMTLAGAAQAKSNFHIDLHFGAPGYSGITFGNGYYGNSYYGNGYFGNGWNYCDKYLWKYNKTGKFKYKKKYMKCMGYW